MRTSYLEAPPSVRPSATLVPDSARGNVERGSPPEPKDFAVIPSKSSPIYHVPSSDAATFVHFPPLCLLPWLAEVCMWTEVAPIPTIPPLSCDVAITVTIAKMPRQQRPFPPPPCLPCPVRSLCKWPETAYQTRNLNCRHICCVVDTSRKTAIGGIQIRCQHQRGRRSCKSRCRDRDCVDFVV